MTETIDVRRDSDGFKLRVVATYDDAADGWTCKTYDGFGSTLDKRGPKETGNDVWLTIEDMIDLALDECRQREACNAGPFSSAQSR